MIPFTIDPDITKATTMPSAWYRDQATFDHIVENVLLPSWQYVASEGELGAVLEDAGQAGASSVCVVPTSILPGTVDEPLLVIREGSATRILSNVCTHRGNILVRKACTPREIRCMYHGRRFDTQGTCVFMPEFKEVAGFPQETDHLRRVEHGSWAGLHFGRLKANGLEHRKVDPSASSPRNSPQERGPLSHDSFESWASILKDRLSFLPLDRAKHRVELDRDFEINAHWALYVENYLEGFHIPFVHPGLNAQLEWNSYETECAEHGVLQIGIARDGDVIFDLPTGHVDFGKRVAAYYYWMFPNTMINVYPWGISLNIILPQSIDRTIIRYRTYVWDESKYNTGAGSSLDTVEAEDDDVVEYQQKGMQSRIYDRGRYSPKREQGVHHFHRMLQGRLSIG